MRKSNFWIQTASGRKFSLTDPQPEDVWFEDIALSLSHMNRFTGHTPVPYSVAEHLVRCSHIVDDEHYAGQAFAHDFAESVIGDISSPLKWVLKEMTNGEFKKYEDKINAVFMDAFGLKYPFHASVKRADLVMLATEKRDLMTKEPEPWCPLPPPDNDVILPWGYETAWSNFRTRYSTLKKQGLIR